MGSDDIGNLGPRDGTPVTVNWSLAWSLLPLSVWVILIPLLFLKANHTWRAWLVLVPVLAMQALTLLPGVMFAVASGVAAGLGVLLLVPYSQASSSRAGSFFRAACIMALAGVIGAAFYSGLSLDPEILGYAMLYGYCGLAMLLGLTVAAAVSRKSYAPGRFMGWLLLWMVVMSMAVAAPVALLQLFGALTFLGPVAVPFMLIGLIAGGIAIGLALYVLLLPFMILALRNSLFRPRFYAMLHLEPMGIPSTTPPPVAAVGGE